MSGESRWDSALVGCGEAEMNKGLCGPELLRTLNEAVGPRVEFTFLFHLHWFLLCIWQNSTKQHAHGITLNSNLGFPKVYQKALLRLMKLPGPSVPHKPQLVRAALAGQRTKDSTTQSKEAVLGSWQPRDYMAAVLQLGAIFKFSLFQLWNSDNKSTYFLRLLWGLNKVGILCVWVKWVSDI